MSDDYENNELFTQEHDEQLLMWLNRLVDQSIKLSKKLIYKYALNVYKFHNGKIRHRITKGRLYSES